MESAYNGRQGLCTVPPEGGASPIVRGHSGGTMTADEQYQQNCAFLATRSNMTATLAQLPQCVLTDIQLMPGNAGHLFGQVWDRPTQTWWALCSPDDPVAEAERDCDNLYTRDAKIFTLLGMGLGYFATALARRLQPWQQLVIWDTEPSMFKAMMYACDISPLFSDKRTHIHIGNDVLAQVEPWWMRLDATDKLHIVLPFRASYTQGPCKVQYDAIMDKTVEMMRFHHVGLSTWKIFGGCIGDNDLRNMPEYFMNPGYLVMKDLWKDRPAICVGAGPSLQKNLRQLLRSEVRDCFAVISVGTVYALLHGLGFEPDIVTTIDFQRLNWTDQFRRVPLDPNCPLVYLHSTYPQTARRWPGPKFVATNASDTTGWIAQFSEPKGAAGQVQTVAHLNVMVALALGANPIILLGQDLSMPVTAHHTAGARAIDAAPAESAEEAFMVLPDYQGHPVHTRHSFLSMRVVFERLIAENPDRIFLHCSEAGLALAGAEHIPLKVALERCRTTTPVRGELRQMLRNVYRDYKPTIAERFGDEWQKLGEWLEDVILFAQGLPAKAAVAAGVTAETITTDMWAAACAEDCMTAQEVVDMCALQRWKAVLDEERVIQERQVALGLVAIRRFEFLELMSQIPPKDDDVATELARAHYNAQRLLFVANLIREEAEPLRALFREVTARLEFLTDPVEELSDRMVQRLYARQRYGTALQALQRTNVHEEGWTEASNRRYQHLYMHYLWHTQQYEATIAVMDAWGFAPQKRERAQRYLEEWRASTREAMEAYFREPVHPQPVGPSVEPWLYD